MSAPAREGAQPPGADVTARTPVRRAGLLLAGVATVVGVWGGLAAPEVSPNGTPAILRGGTSLTAGDVAAGAPARPTPARTTPAAAAATPVVPPAAPVAPPPPAPAAPAATPPPPPARTAPAPPPAPTPTAQPMVRR